jgi:soluble P-type ATPase
LSRETPPAARVEVVLRTADTFGTARAALARLPVTVQVVRGGEDKRRYVEAVGRGSVAAVGNGVNDVAYSTTSRRPGQR